jgi:hypothetical protein
MANSSHHPLHIAPHWLCIERESDSQDKEFDILQKGRFSPGHEFFRYLYVMKRLVHFIASRPTWGIASLHQTTDFTPGYIAESVPRIRARFSPRWHDHVAYIMYKVV